MCIDAPNAVMKKNFFPVWASCPLWKPIWSILTGIYGPKAQAALVAHPEAHVSVERAMYQCGACGKLESRLAVTMKAPVPVPILQRCDCGATMHRIRSGKDILCPACREPLKKTDVVAVTMWD